MDILNGTLSHAYIIIGDEQAGFNAACSLAAVFVCSGGPSKPCGKCTHCQKAAKGVHPDVIVVDREEDKREIYVDSIRSVCTDAYVLPNEAAHKVYIVKHADTMNSYAQNAFLKTLEEPPSYAAFLLLSENPGLLLQTVRSRCIEISLEPQSTALSSDRAEAFLKTLASGGKTELMEALCSLEALSRGDFTDFLSELRSLCASCLRGEHPDIPLASARLMQILRLLAESEKYLNFNVGTGHIAGLFMSELVR